MRGLLPLLLLPALALATAAGQAAGPPPVARLTVGFVPELALEAPSPRVDGGEFSRRLLSPIAADDIARFVQSQGRRLAPEAFAPGQDSVELYVPAKAPAGGYGLIVFIPPSDEFAWPRDWRAALDKRGLILVMLHHAGNEVDVIGRRIPLALHAHQAVADRYALDPSRIYIAGFSGGARLAQRIAMAWPDLFAGSLQFAGSVVVGQSRLPPPPAELMARVQEHSRLVLVTGAIDLANRRNDGEARAVFEELCVAGVRSLGPARLDHWVPDGRVFAKALALLEQPVAPDPGQAACRARLQAAIDAGLAEAAAASEAGRHDEAVAMLVALDDRYGGLAAPASIQLAHAIMARRDAASD